MNITFETTIGLGWGIYARETSYIARKAREFGVSLAPFPWRKLHELVAPLSVKVEGDPAAVAKFAAFMDSAYGVSRVAPVAGVAFEGGRA